MHMADALLSPTVGAIFIGGSAIALGISSKKLSRDSDDRKAPLMGVLGAFVFAAQMINFTIPGTGSSGHIGGGMLLAMLLGPYAAFIVITSVLIVQALIFADGGILALGTNVWNLGVYPCFLGWLIYKAIAAKNPTRSRVASASIFGVLIGLELGALSVVIQTVLSGRIELPFVEFSAVMVGIHLPIALVEGVITMAVVNFVYQIRPEIVKESLGLKDKFDKSVVSYKPVMASLFILALLIGAIFSWFASSHPDGLEWAIMKTHGEEELNAPETGIIPELEKIQEKISPLPGYAIKKQEADNIAEGEESWPNISGGTSLSGVVGSVIVLIMMLFFGFIMVKLRKTGKTVE